MARQADRNAMEKATSLAMIDSMRGQIQPDVLQELQNMINMTDAERKHQSINAILAYAEEQAARLATKQYSQVPQAAKAVIKEENENKLADDIDDIKKAISGLSRTYSQIASQQKELLAQVKQQTHLNQQLLEIISTERIMKQQTAQDLDLLLKINTAPLLKAIDDIQEQAEISNDRIDKLNKAMHVLCSSNAHLGMTFQRALDEIANMKSYIMTESYRNSNKRITDSFPVGPASTSLFNNYSMSDCS